MWVSSKQVHFDLFLQTKFYVSFCFLIYSTNMRVINTTHTQFTPHLSQLYNLFKKKIYDIKCSFKYGIKNIALSPLFLMV